MCDLSIVLRVTYEGYFYLAQSIGDIATSVGNEDYGNGDIVGNGDISGNGDINFGTPLS